MKLLNRLRALFRKEELDRELSDEMTFHLEKQIEQNMEVGMNAVAQGPHSGPAALSMRGVILLTRLENLLAGLGGRPKPPPEGPQGWSASPALRDLT